MSDQPTLPRTVQTIQYDDPTPEAPTPPPTKFVDGVPTTAPKLSTPISRLRPCGQRVVVKLVEDEVKTKNGVIIPSKRAESFNRLGKILAVGSGWYQGEQHSMYSRPGDICFFQLEQQQAGNTSYIDPEHGLIFFLHDLDMIARLTEPSFDLENFPVIGPWVLVKVETRNMYPNSKIVLPQVENTTSELQTYTVLQKGDGVKIDIKVGDEISLARSRCNPLYLDRQLYGWIEEKFIYGAITTKTTTDEAPAPVQPTA